ncbi:unnamed protein product [Ceratitis capitata]|uniref:(Mediterranean fruit fly) hypothetical protein n=1 Tax=Ceratitis capitata TaxID=7213 RepID=A0A811UT30_CERCA|nr:unnamed protein product [Ceratitis capitata]
MVKRSVLTAWRSCLRRTVVRNPKFLAKTSKSKVTERDKASSFLQQMALKFLNPRSFCRYMKYLAVGTRSNLLVIAPRERSRHLTYFVRLTKIVIKKQFSVKTFATKWRMFLKDRTGKASSELINKYLTPSTANGTKN